MLFVSVGRRFVAEQVVPVAVFVRRVCSRGCVVLARHCIPGSVSWVKLSHDVVGGACYRCSWVASFGLGGVWVVTGSGLPR